MEAISSVDWFGSIGFVIDRLCIPIYKIFSLRGRYLWMVKVYMGVLIVDALMWMQRTFFCNRCWLVVVVSALDGSVGLEYILVL